MMMSQELVTELLRYCKSTFQIPEPVERAQGSAGRRTRAAEMLGEARTRSDATLVPTAW